MSGKRENGEYVYDGGSHGLYTCHDCGRKWLADLNGAMTPKDSPATAEQHDGADKTVNKAADVDRFAETYRHVGPDFGSTGR